MAKRNNKGAEKPNQGTEVMMHGCRGTPTFMPALLLLLFSSLWVSTTRGEMPMQQLSRADLVRIAGYGEERLSSVLVIGTLVCDACRVPEPSSSLLSSHVTGAKVAVGCRTEGNKRKINWTHGTTDEYGEFMVDLPSHLHAIPRLEEACIVKVLRMPKNSFCKLISAVRPRGIRLSSVGNSIRVYSAGTIRLSPEARPSHQCSKTGEDNAQITW